MTGNDGKPTPMREVNRLVDEYLRPMNHGLESLGSATLFRTYVESTYKPIAEKQMAKSTYWRYGGVLKNYLLPAFGNSPLRDLTALTLDRYFCELAERNLP